MAIRLETSKRTGIKNYQDREISAFELNWARALPAKYPRAIPRTSSTALYNCHGLTFASRRTKIVATSQIQTILNDDSYRQIPMKDVKPGDVVIYFSENDDDANHSGIVVEYRPDYAAPIICSKWGNGGEFIHGLSDCPSMYGPTKKFYRCEP
jgi:hypothetical protein